MPEKDYTDLLKQVGAEGKAIKTIRKMQEGYGQNKDCVRLVPSLSQHSKNEYLRNYEQIALRKYDVIKVRPKICDLVDEA